VRVRRARSSSPRPGKITRPRHPVFGPSPWVVAPRRSRLVRDALQISETVLDPVMYLVRQSDICRRHVEFFIKSTFVDSDAVSG
jgi:hypothetical protein